MDILEDIGKAVLQVVQELYNVDIAASDLVITPTKKEHRGDFTLVTFPLAKALKKAPPVLAQEIGERLRTNHDWIESTEVIQGFLNILLSNTFWKNSLSRIEKDPGYWKPRHDPQKILVEFSSPNTNKPLHLGHIRNILLGWSTYKILQACGHDVVRVQVVNDRGIAICKSMLAWMKFANGQRPEVAGIKSDHFVGDWYVRFEKEFQVEYKAWQQTDHAKGIFDARKDKELNESAFFKEYKNHYFNTESALGREARDLLLKWEANDPETISLWKMMNDWVYAGFEATYRKLEVEFDRYYYESNTYLLGKDIVQQGVDKNIFYKKPDGSVWVDLTDKGLDEKILLRSDGTSVYITQDIGTAEMRYEELGAERMIYVVADEQNYHFQALFATLEKLGAPYAPGLHHLSYGMVDLPEGKMKSREGTVVDADDLIAEVIEEAREAARERENEDDEMIRRIAMSALKFFITKVDPKKRMIFDPKASVDLQGQTGPYVQNAYVRIQSILRKAGDKLTLEADYQLIEDEKLLLNMLLQCRQVIDNAAREYNPSLIAHYAYALAKEYHRYYHDVKVLQAESEEARAFRLRLIHQIAAVLKNSFELLGMEMPERM